MSANSNVQLIPGSSELSKTLKNIQFRTPWHYLFVLAFLLVWGYIPGAFSCLIPEYALWNAAIRLDLYAQKNSEVTFSDLIGGFFREYNFISYKSPIDSFLPLDFQTLLSYVTGFLNKVKSAQPSRNNITLNAFTTKYPHSLLQFFEDCKIEYERKPLWLIRAEIMGYKVQIVCIGKLNVLYDETDDMYFPLRMIRNDLTTDDVKKIQEYVDQIKQTGNEERIFLVKEFCETLSTANEKVFREVCNEMSFIDELVRERFGTTLDAKDLEISQRDQMIQQQNQKIKELNAEIKKRDRANKQRAVELIRNRHSASIIAAGTGLAMDVLQALSDSIKVPLVLP